MPNIIMADAKGPTDFLYGKAIVTDDRNVTIPLTATMKNFVATQDLSDEETPSELGYIVACYYRLNYLSDTRLFFTRVTNWAATPPTNSVAALSTTSVSETATSITMNGTNGNTTGLLVPGATVRYFVW